MAGVVELATATETRDGTDSTRAVHPAGLKSALDRKINVQQPAWIAPTLLNGWVNQGGGFETAGYRKNSLGVVEVKGALKNGVAADATVLFLLPDGYRPANTRTFVGIQGGGSSYRLDIRTSGEVTIVFVTNNAFLSIEARFSI